MQSNGKIIRSWRHCCNHQQPSSTAAGIGRQLAHQKSAWVLPACVLSTAELSNHRTPNISQNRSRITHKSQSGLQVLLQCSAHEKGALSQNQAVPNGGIEALRLNLYSVQGIGSTHIYFSCQGSTLQSIAHSVTSLPCRLTLAVSTCSADYSC